MQQIERVGVIALLLMVVTIVVVALWDDEGESSKQVQASVEGPAKKERPREPAARERESLDASGLRSTRANARQRTTAILGESSSASARDDGNVPVSRATDAWRRRSGSTPERERVRAAERPPETSVALSVPEPQPEPASVAPSRTGSGPVAAGIEFDQRRRNETRKPPRSGPMAQPVSVRPDPAPAREDAAVRGAYVVESGDSLERIARRLLGDGSRWPELAALNGIDDPLKLHVGAKLKLPGGSKPATDAPAPGRAAERSGPSSQRPAGGRIYVVQPGDILGRIAQRELGSARHWRQIVELNPKVDPERLLVGARLVLPDVGAPAETARPSSLVAKADPRVDSPYRVR